MDEMTEMDEKAVVRINSDGDVTKCAKGAVDGCGYKAGAKVCGKCGAMAVQIKKVASDEDEEDLDFEMEDEEEDEEETVKKGLDEAEEYEGMDDEKMPPKKKNKRTVTMRNPDGLDEDDTPDPDAEEMDESDEAPDESNAEMGETPVEAMGEADRKRRMAARKRRMASMNVKSAAWGDDAYVCGFEGKMLSGDTSPCAACPGGCCPESDLPTLLEVQGLAEGMLGGKVLDSGYAESTDIFVVDVQRKDGRIAEAFYDGVTAECLGWNLLDDAMIGEKSAQQPFDIVSGAEAAEIAVKTLPGQVMGVDADVFEGYDVYAVAIEGADGKSYDGFVSLDGELLGYDEYDPEEAAAIDAEVAEYALKAAYSDDDREMMVKEGEAMEDGSFPIKNVDDLKNAIQSFGRAKDKASAKIHIMRRAEALDSMDLIPETWLSGDGPEGKGEFDPEFLANLMEFELLATETDLD